MRSISAIKEEIDIIKDTLKECEDELKTIIKECPHPKPFVHKEHKSNEDDYGKEESSYVIYHCSLCEGQWMSKDYNNNIYGDGPPLESLEEVIMRKLK